MSGDRQVGSRVICYSDGWCEQGGFITGGGSAVTVTLLKPYKNTRYSVTTAEATATASGNAGQANSEVKGSAMTYAKIVFYVNTASAYLYWRAAGMITLT